ncbi:hypothetical protein J6590_094259 [Homalodisca vitripennis]|nr:hypothetical protein J6590_094259 [Homalodisca vitripennis]
MKRANNKGSSTTTSQRNNSDSLFLETQDCVPLRGMTPKLWVKDNLAMEDTVI